MNIVSDQKLPGTCQVCGKPISELLIQFGAGGTEKFVCGQCSSDVCSKCYSRSRRKCVRCTTGSSSWCKIPGLPGMPG